MDAVAKTDVRQAYTLETSRHLYRTHHLHESLIMNKPKPNPNSPAVDLYDTVIIDGWLPQPTAGR